MSLTDLFFATDFFNRLGRANIRGDELAALLSTEGGLVGGQIGKGALVQRAPAETITDGFPGVTIIFTSFPIPTYDDLGFWSAGDPTKLTVPLTSPPIQRVQITCSTVWSSDASSSKHIEIKKNGITVDASGLAGVPASAGAPVTTQYINAVSAPFSVVAGDFFELQAIQFSSPSASKTLARATMAILVVK